MFAGMLIGESADRLGFLFAAAVSATLVSYLANAILPALRLKWKLAKFPIINKEKGEWLSTNAVKRCASNMNAILQEGYEKYDGPFRIIGAFGSRLVLPPATADAVKNDPRFTAKEVVEKTMGSSLPGFEGLRAPDVLIMMIRNNLSTNLGKFTQDLADETQAAFDEIWGTSTEWREIELMSSLRDIMSQISTRIFLGAELAKDRSWQKNTKEYTNELFLAVREIRAWPEWARAYVHWFLPKCRLIRKQVKRAEELIQPIIEKRVKEAREAEKGLREMPQDAITWAYQTAKGKDYHAAHVQLAFSMASVHTTSDLFSNVLLQLCRHPEWKERLLREAQRALEGGWEKTSLYKMKLADSLIRETQRIKPLGVLLTHRYATEDVTAPDGTLIPKGALVASNMSRMWDPKYFPNPEEWQPDRFLRLRDQPGKEHSAQLVTTTTEASNMKVMLFHLLQNYEFERADTGVDAFPWFIEYVTNPKAKLRVRRRV
ncbi:cytochrome p450 [Hirsutella rhossiliensis]|uniref:Cytochrome p450 domain-containing protein n=1 Tax=Hirsutella rhossiliensis TaxID=111463 RepID=A0A9P8MSQ7_9HYPO|nr:cytochrome p450 domain-containing protein [Hirsutella rhossiliensis]KAH0960595.1 cytochrome p450 domain-containing protein [Hirsutella rhossiliensis]